MAIIRPFIVVSCNCNSIFLFVEQFLLPAGHAQSARPAGPKITLPFPHLYIYMCVRTYHVRNNYVTWLLPCDLTLVGFGNLDGCYA